MSEMQKYDDAVKAIKTAILQSQYEAARSVNERQLRLYYGIGKYISANSRKGFWGKGAIDAISEQLQNELPGLKGFSARNLRDMRIFYEQWMVLDGSEAVNARTALPDATAERNVGVSNLAPMGAKLEVTNQWLPLSEQVNCPASSFFAIGFTLHRTILSKVKGLDERVFYIRKSADEKYTREELEAAIVRDDYRHQGALPNNFSRTLSSAGQALRAIGTFNLNVAVERPQS